MMHSEGRADKHTFDSKLLFSKVLFSFLVSGYSLPLAAEHAISFGFLRSIAAVRGGH